jgi:hypothetical protein
VVAVHVRRGDFRSLRVGEDFAHVGLVRTADQYFADLIEQIRHVSGWDLPVTVFSDGTDDEIAFLTRMPGVRSPATSRRRLLHGACANNHHPAGSTFRMGRYLRWLFAPSRTHSCAHPSNPIY